MRHHVPEVGNMVAFQIKLPMPLRRLDEEFRIGWSKNGLDMGQWLLSRQSAGDRAGKDGLSRARIKGTERRGERCPECAER